MTSAPSSRTRELGAPSATRIASAGGGPAAANSSPGKTRALVDRLNASGEMLVTGTRVNGRDAVRFVVGNLHTRERHVLEAWRAIESTAASVLRETAAP